jgi:hypothetical protein
MSTSEWDETAARLREEADRDYPDAWIPKAEGDELLGRIVSLRPAVQTAYGPAPVVELEDPLGTTWSVWLLHTVLRRAFERERPALGELVLIRYVGKVQPDGGGPAYEHYRLVVDRKAEGGEPDWVGMAERYGDESAADRVARDNDDRPPPGDEDVPF